MQYHPKKALITGANSGIGRELAYLLAAQGVSLILVARNYERLEEVARICRQKVIVETLCADLTQTAGLQAVCVAIDRHSPDLVVNNAGIGLYGDCVSSEISESRTIIQTNCESVVTISQKSAQALLKKKRSGVILNVSSVLAFFPAPGSCVYAATKCFVKHFSKALDFELRESSIRVLCCFPGQVATSFRKSASKGCLQNQSGFFVLNPQYVAKKMYQQILAQKQSAIIDYRYKVLVGLCKILPEKWVMSVLLKMMRKKVTS